MRGPTRVAAEAFLQYLFTPEAQAEFAACGFRWGPRDCYKIGRILTYHCSHAEYRTYSTWCPTESYGTKNQKAWRHLQ